MNANRSFARPVAAIGLLALLGRGAGIRSRRDFGRAARAGRADGTAAARHLGRSLCRCFARLRFFRDHHARRPATSIPTVSWAALFAGYNLQNGLFVYGIEGDVGYSGVEGDNGITETKSGVEGSLRGRMGFAVTDDVLLYGTAGGAAERLKVSDPAGDDSNALYGWTAGARRGREADRTGVRARRVSLHRLRLRRFQHRQRLAVGRFEGKPRHLRHRHEVLIFQYALIRVVKAGPRARLSF